MTTIAEGRVSVCQVHTSHTYAANNTKNTLGVSVVSVLIQQSKPGAPDIEAVLSLGDGNDGLKRAQMTRTRLRPGTACTAVGEYMEMHPTRTHTLRLRQTKYIRGGEQGDHSAAQDN